MRQIRVTQYGGPEQMQLVELPDPVPAPGEALVRVTVAGVNCMDIAARSMPLPGWGLPAAMGVEGAGRVEAIGAGVENLAPGDRVAWFYHPCSYADLAAVRAESLVKIPEVVDDQTAAAVMMQGLTAHHLVTETYPGRRWRHRRGAGRRGRRRAAAHPAGQGRRRPRYRPGLRQRAGEVFDLVAAGKLTPRIGARYPLADAAKAHADLASRRTVGK